MAQEIYAVAVASGLVILQNMYTGNPHLSCSQVRELLYNTSKDWTQQQWIQDKIGLSDARVNHKPWAHYKGWMMGLIERWKGNTSSIRVPK